MFNILNYLKAKSKSDKKDISKAIANIDLSIKTLLSEINNFSSAIDYIEAQYEKSKEAAEVSTIFPFLNLSMLDILILNKQYLRTDEEIEKNFICRTAAQHMYEFLEDASKALGKQMNVLTDRLNNDKINQELKELRKAFNDLKGELHLPLKKLRHNVSGHKDRDIRSQLNLSSNIDIEGFFINFVLFLLFFMRLTKFKRNVVDEIKRL